jgi:glycerophosphoryl diester phosphodiesterase
MKLIHAPIRRNAQFLFGILISILLILIGVPAQRKESRETHSDNENTLVGRAILDAATFAPAPTSGRQLGDAPINGQPVPFIDKQPVQGFSAVLYNGYGTYLAM